MDQKGYIIDQKGLNMYKKRQKIEFSDLKKLHFSRIFLSGIGGNHPLPPWTDNHCAQKTSRWRAWSLVQKFYKSVFSGTPCSIFSPKLTFKSSIWTIYKSGANSLHFALLLWVSYTFVFVCVDKKNNFFKCILLREYALVSFWAAPHCEIS